MKKLLSIVTLFVLSSTAMANFQGNGNTGGGFQGEPSGQAVSVAQALKAADHTMVQLTGKIVRQIDGDEFIFRDGSGEIKIDVEDEAWQGQNVTANDTITIYGTVDNDAFEKATVEVFRVKK